MGGLRAIAITAAVVAALAIALSAGCRLALQHRAVYPGGLTFVGAADGLLGSRYHRVYLWRAPHGTDTLPAFTLHVEARAMPLASLTPELLGGAPGSPGEGALYDSRGALLKYRFENGRLTWLSIDAGVLPAGQPPGGNVMRGEFGLSRGAGSAVTLPVSLSALRRALGAPERTMLHFAQ